MKFARNNDFFLYIFIKEKSTLNYLENLQFKDAVKMEHPIKVYNDQIIYRFIKEQKIGIFLIFSSEFICTQCLSDITVIAKHIRLNVHIIAF